MKIFSRFLMVAVLWTATANLGRSQSDDGLGVPVRLAAKARSTASDNSDALVSVDVERPDGTFVTLGTSNGGVPNETYLLPATTVSLEPGRTYSVRIFTHKTNYVEPIAVPPAGYEIRWAGELGRKRSFPTPDPDALGFYDDYVSLQVVPAATTQPPARAGTPSSIANGAVRWQVAMGSMPNGTSAGYLQLLESGRGASGFGDVYNLFTGVHYIPPSDDVQVYRGSTAVQIVAYEAGVNIVPFGTSYQIKFYHRAQVTDLGVNANPRFSFGGDPFVCYFVDSPDSSNTKLRITSESRQLPNWTTSGLTPIRTAVTTVTRAGTWPAYTWTVDDWTTQGASVLVRDTRTWSAGSGSYDHSETAQIFKPGDSVNAGYATRSYTQKSWGEALASEANASSSSISSTYAYYETSSEAGSYTYPKLVAKTGGTWQAYEYYPAAFTSDPLTDTSFKTGLIKRSHKPFQNTTAPAAGDDLAPRSAGEITNFEYASDAFTQAWGQSLRPTLIETRLDGTLSAKSTISYVDSILTINSQLLPLVSAQRVDYPMAGGGVLVGTSNYFREDAADLFFRGQPYSLTQPDGTRDVYGYERGSLSGSTFTPSYTGLASRVTVIHGTASTGTLRPALANFPLDTVYLVNFKSTKEVTLRDQYARVARSEAYVWNGTTGDWTLISYADFSYDYANHLTGCVASNGATYSAVFNGEQLQSETDEAGVQTSYVYDGAGRVDRAQKAAAPGLGALTTQFAYDGAGRTIQQQRGVHNGTAFVGETITASRIYDDGGRLVHEYAPGPNGASHTSYAYSPSTRQKTVNLPNGGSRTETYLADGLPSQVTGSAAVAQYYSYAVETDGRRYTKITTGQSGGSRFREQWVDWLGRPTKFSRPGFTGQGAFEQVPSYDSITGRLDTLARTGYATAYYTYDALSQPARVGLDVTGSGIQDASADRISESDTLYEYDSATSDWWVKKVAKTYPTLNDGTAKVVSITRQRLTVFSATLPGFSGGALFSETQTTDVNGNLSIVQVFVDRSGQTSKVVTKVKNSAGAAIHSYDQVLTLVAGMPTSMQGYDGLTESVGYDALHRRSTMTDTRNLSTTTYYRTGSTFVDHITGYTSAAGAIGTLGTYSYDDAGRVMAVADANGKVTRTDYNTLDQVVRSWGNGTTPVEYGYDSTYGDRVTMRTYRAGTGWEGVSGGNWLAWPGTGNNTAASTGTADWTRWAYDEPSGLLKEKYDAANLNAGTGLPIAGAKKVSYGYNVRGQIYQRTWARGVTSTYGYDGNTGELTGVTYSDSTPTVSYTYTRTGALKTAGDATGTQTLNYGTASGSHALQLDSIDLPVFYSTRRLTRTYDTAKRPTGFTLGTTGSPAADLAQGYAYNALGRFDHLDVGSSVVASRTINYTYGAGGLWSGYGAADKPFGVVRTYEPYRDLLASLDSTWSAVSRTRYDYVSNVLGQRYTAKQSGDVFSDYGIATYRRNGYDDKGEVTTSADYQGDTPPVLGAGPDTANQLPNRNFSFEYDNAGNRIGTSRSGVVAPQTTGRETYSPGSRNEYSSRSNTYTYAAGTVANNTITVGVNGGNLAPVTGRRGRYWSTTSDTINQTTPAIVPLTVTATAAGAGSGGTDLVRTDTSRSVLLAPRAQSFTYDDDGNLKTDGLWTYTYDAENRLISQENDWTVQTAIGAVNSRRLDFVYDYLGRRVQKLVLALNAGAYTSVVYQRRYLYDGANVVAELSGDGTTVVRSYAWGLDLAASLGSTGGVGALVQITDHTASMSYFPTYDGNGNVVSLLRASDGLVMGRYEYSPFGELLRCEGALARENPFRFSTKFTDDETGLVYYGARYYSPSLGRFINRDPIEEGGGLNLYGFCGNDGVNSIDYLGMDPVVMETFVVTGTKIGSAFGPVGAVVGGVIGAVVGLFSSNGIFGKLFGGGGSKPPPKPATISPPNSHYVRGKLNPNPARPWEWEPVYDVEFPEEIRGWVQVGYYSSDAVQLAPFEVAASKVSAFKAAFEGLSMAIPGISMINGMIDDYQKNLKLGGGHFNAINMTFNPAYMAMSGFNEMWSGIGMDAHDLGETLSGWERTKAFGKGVVGVVGTVGAATGITSAGSSMLRTVASRLPRPPVGHFGPFFDNRSWSVVRNARNRGLLNAKGRNWTWEHYFLRQTYYNNSVSSWARGFGNSYFNTALRIPRGFNSSLGNSTWKRWAFRIGVPTGLSAGGGAGYMLGSEIYSEFLDPLLAPE